MQDSSAHKLTVTPMNETPKQSITIKKYANRRLYNTATSSYVTLETLAGMVKEGIEFNVYDAKTSEDITRSVLTQIIVEEEGKSGQQCLLPISFLRQLISFYGANMQWLVPKYLEHSMESLSKNQDQLTNYFQTTFGNMFPFGSTLEEMGKQNMAMFENAMRLFSPFVPSSTEAAPKPTARPASCDVRVSASQTPDLKKNEESLATITPIARKADLAPVVQPEPKPEPKFEQPRFETKVEIKQELKPEPKTAPVAESIVTPPPAPEPVAVVEPVKEPTAALTAILEAISVAPAPAPVSEPIAAPAAVASVPPAVIEPVVAPTPVQTSSTPPTAAAPAPISMPTPNVQSVTASAPPTADDMQQKIANLQRQLAELAKNRA